MDLSKYNIEDFEKSMTLFYYKRDGEIYSYCTGISDMSSFGKYAEDYSLIMDYVVVPLDNLVIEYIKQFYVDTDSKEVRIKDNGLFNIGKYINHKRI